MTNSFVTLEDVNGAMFDNQGFWRYELDTALIDPTDNAEFSNITVDFCTISRETFANTRWKYIVEVDNDLWTTGNYALNTNGRVLTTSVSNNTLSILVDKQYAPIKIYLYMGSMKITKNQQMLGYLLEDTLLLPLNKINRSYNVKYFYLWDSSIRTVTIDLKKGFNEVIDGNVTYGYLLVKLLKTDFQFLCNQQLTVGEVNTVQLGTLTDYKPNGDMIGTNTPNITVKYGDIYIPVRYDSSLNDYVFDIDLTSKQTEGKVRFNVIVDTNDVLNNTETEVTLQSNYETINNESKLITLFKNGGIGRLGANITLTTDLTLDKDVLIIGNSKTINMQSHKIIVPSERTFKAETTIFTNGKNTIQQNTGSTVELTACGFNSCTGFGSVIDCQTDLTSLTIENDFITNITNCVFNNNDMCILHGGELNITGCDVTGKIGNPNNPYFLYQTDGNATILQSTFNLSSDTQIEEDIEFNSCIFTCGESAIINGDSHDELQRNDITSFISNPQNNASKINVTYYYPAIEDYITLQSDNGYCHSCSGVDYVFKNNVTVRRD